MSELLLGLSSFMRGDVTGEELIDLKTVRGDEVGVVFLVGEIDLDVGGQDKDDINSPNVQSEN